MRNVFEDGSLEGILIPIGNAIKNCENIINGTSSTNNEDYIDSVTDYEVEIIENILDECAQMVINSHLCSYGVAGCFSNLPDN